MPAHEWEGPKLRLQKPNGRWGEFVNLLGPRGRAGEDGTNGSGGSETSVAECVEDIQALSTTNVITKFSPADVEIEAILNAQAAKINEILTALKNCT